MIIKIYIDQVSNLDSKLRAKVDDHQDDGQFNNSAAQISQHVAKEAGF